MARVNLPGTPKTPMGWASGVRMIDRVRTPLNDRTGTGISLIRETVDASDAMDMPAGETFTYTEDTAAYVVYLKRGRAGGSSLRALKSFVRLMAKHPDARATALDDYGHAYEIVGEYDTLQTIIGHVCVFDAHPLLTLRVPISASGNGAEKVRTQKKEIFGTRTQIGHTATVIAEQISRNIASQAN